MKYLLLLTGNKIIIAALVGWFSAQLIKTAIGIIKTKRFDFRRLYGAGGMPSSHSSFVVATAVSLGKYEGFDSPMFALAVVLAIVVMYDAAGIRRAAGEQAKILNYMVDHWSETTPEMLNKELKELLGHTPLEVIAGAALGIAIGLLI